MTAQHLVIGLDGADLNLIQSFGPGRLPHLHRLMAEGVYAPLQSVQPPATLPNWATFLTGVDPGRHGVFDFTTRRGYRVKFTAGSVRESPTWIARLDELGMRCACLFFPGTYPPERLRHGLYVSGWDAPVAFEADRSFVWPPSWYDRLRSRFGVQRFSDVDEFDSEAPGWHERLPAILEQRVALRSRACQTLVREQAWDVFAVYFGESDTAAHHLWALHDPRSPRRPAFVSPTAQDGLARVYAALDRAVGELWRAAGGRACELTIVSDHGFGGSSDRVLYLNRVLEQAGLLRFKRRNPLRPLIFQAKELALTRLPPAMRERIFRFSGTALPSVLESAARFGQIDMAHTQVFSDELNYFPALHLNLRGREPRGIVLAEQEREVVARVEQVLTSLRDPWDGTPVVRAVHRRGALFSGPFLERAPDLLLELHPCAGYSYNLMPSSAAPAACGAFRRLTPDEFLGRKGRSLQGSHREHGFYLAAGPSVRARGPISARIADAAATALARMGVAHDPLAAGRPLSLGDEGPAPSPPGLSLPAGPVSRGASPDSHGEARVADRLRRLGYIE